jgi:tetratricopeptide (TPR) repeat protein
VDFYIEQGYFDIALDTLNLLEGQFGSHPNLDARRKQIESASQPPANAAADIFAPTIEHPGSVDLTTPQPVDELPEAVVVSSNGSKPAKEIPDSLIDPGLAEIFEEFRLSEEGANTNGDYETHYNRGLAYKEMDLLEDAVGEFQIAIRLAAAGDGTSRYLQCCNLLGHCFLQQRVPRLAVAWFNRGLAAQGHSEDEYQALRFDLGLAYEQMGEIDRALEIFTEIYGINVSYRGVKEKLHELQTRSKESSEFRL